MNDAIRAVGPFEGITGSAASHSHLVLTWPPNEHGTREMRIAGDGTITLDGHVVTDERDVGAAVLGWAEAMARSVPSR